MNREQDRRLVVGEIWDAVKAAYEAGREYQRATTGMTEAFEKGGDSAAACRRVRELWKKWRLLTDKASELQEKWNNVNESG